MNKKITFPELVDAVATITNTSKRTSEAFLKELFATITDALARGENVKIKNFGVFKLVEVGERKSVNVNTGEEMQIPGHVKVSFSPDKSLADAINTPFASFETVILSDDLSDDDLRKLSSYDKAEPEIAETAFNVNSAETEKKEEIVIDKDVAIATDVKEDAIVPPPFNQNKRSEQEDANDNAEGEVIATDEQRLPVVDDNAVIEESKHDDNEHELKGNDERDSETSDEQESICGSDEHDDENEDSVNKDDDSDCDNCRYYRYSRHYRHRSKRKSFAKGFLCGSITMLLIVGIGMYVYMLFTSNNATTSSKHVTESVALAVDGVSEEVDTTDVAADSAVVEVKEEPQVLRYDTISRSRFLTSMSRTYYGDYHFWVYIYEENKDFLGNPNAIPPGTVVVIPPAEKYGIDKNNPESLNAAIEKAAEIMKPYEQ